MFSCNCWKFTKLSLILFFLIKKVLFVQKYLLPKTAKIWKKLLDQQGWRHNLIDRTFTHAYQPQWNKKKHPSENQNHPQLISGSGRFSTTAAVTVAATHRISNNNGCQAAIPTTPRSHQITISSSMSVARIVFRSIINRPPHFLIIRTSIIINIIAAKRFVFIVTNRDSNETIECNDAITKHNVEQHDESASESIVFCLLAKNVVVVLRTRP